MSENIPNPDQSRKGHKMLNYQKFFEDPEKWNDFHEEVQVWREEHPDLLLERVNDKKQNLIHLRWSPREDHL